MRKSRLQFFQSCMEQIMFRRKTETLSSIFSRTTSKIALKFSRFVLFIRSFNFKQKRSQFKIQSINHCEYVFIIANMHYNTFELTVVYFSMSVFQTFFQVSNSSSSNKVFHLCYRTDHALNGTASVYTSISPCFLQSLKKCLSKKENNCQCDYYDISYLVIKHFVNTKLLSSISQYQCQ